MTGNTSVEDQKPRSEVFEQQQLICWEISIPIGITHECAIGLDEVVEEVDPVPHCLCQVTAETFHGVVNIEERRPKVLKLLLRAVQLDEAFGSVFTKQLEVLF